MKQPSMKDVFEEHQSKKQKLLKQHPLPWDWRWGKMHALDTVRPGSPIATCKAVMFWREQLLWWNKFCFFL